MNIKILFSGLALSGLLLYPVVIQAQQQEPDEIALANDEFENNFYEALKQKGIENYDKALQALQRCVALQPDNDAVYNEIGKNQLALRSFGDAERAFLKATQLDPANRWYWQGLYDVYYGIQNWNKAIPVVQKLTQWRKEFYEEDLVSLYMYTMQYDKALVLINSLDDKVGQSDKRAMYRAQIMQDDRFRKPKKESLEEAIKKNPKEESNYLELIYLYSESNQEAKAEEVAKKLEKEIPNSDWAQVSLFKFHLNNNEGGEAAKSLFRILESEKIDRKIKHRAFNEFLIFVNNNPQFNNDLAKAADYFEDDKEVNVPKEVGKFFFTKKDYARAGAYFEKSLAANADDIEAIELLLYTYEGNNQNELLLKKASSYIDLYPTHARLYYFAGVAANNLSQFKKAKDWLESGIDFVVEDAELEVSFTQQLARAFEGIGDVEGSDAYKRRIEGLLKLKKTK
ncbi:cytochrome C biosynthesis protein [Flavobacterium arcticum]|uniref:Cytochrome C biosynthesis protein n=1 Tax=Flavobacterium arcticum TaxID=1784713 RepID=A0A345HAW5_9FLAO|nr:cytochrome C biosynthesis protein [Flavobacterium arcticum]AXG73725.1 cytochrome C biosynthesis protein [Flavobacterium arcticum]KAF2511676.1 cytochrome C biosynthesis protein [Flavobacterium arcticum]